MEVFSVIIKIIVLLMSIFLVVAVLMQEGKSYGLGAIEGGANNFFGKTKGQQVSSKLSRFTTIVAIVFVAVVVILGTFSQRNGNWYEDLDPNTKFEDPSFGKKTEEPAATATAKPTVTVTPAGTVEVTTTPAATETAE